MRQAPAPGCNPCEALQQQPKQRLIRSPVSEARNITDIRSPARKACNHPVFEVWSGKLPALGQHLNFHLCHVNPGWALTAASFATDAKRQSLSHRGIVQACRAELTACGKSQGVGSTAHAVLFVAGDTKARTHHCGVKFAAMSVVITHLKGFAKALSRIATCARRGQRLGERIVLHVPGRPVQRRFHGLHRITGSIAEKLTLIHRRAAHDLAGVHQSLRIKSVLDLLKGFVESIPVLPAHPLAAHQPIAVLTRKSALVSPNQGTGLLGNRAHRQRALAPHVENRAHVQGSDRSVGIPGTACAVAGKNLGERARVFGKMLKRHSAIFDKAHRFSITAQAHHDVESRFTNLPERLLRDFLRHADHTTGLPQITHQRHQIVELISQTCLLMPAEFHKQNRLWRCFARVDQRAFHDFAKRRILASKVNHRPVNQFNGRRFELDDVLCCIHGCRKALEIDNTKHLVFGQGREAQTQLAEQT